MTNWVLSALLFATLASGIQLFTRDQDKTKDHDRLKDGSCQVSTVVVTPVQFNG